MNKYPMTYEEFKEKCIESAKKRLCNGKNDEAINTYLAGEEAEFIIKGKYKVECDYYDGKVIYSKSIRPPFNDGAIATCAYELFLCCDY